MHTVDPEYLPELTFQRFSASGDGMHIEVMRRSGTHEPFMTFRADESLGLQVVLHGSQGDIAFPLSELKRVVAIAEADVHPESFFDQKPFTP